MKRCVVLLPLLLLGACFYGTPRAYAPPRHHHVASPGHYRWDGTQWVWVR